MRLTDEQLEAIVCSQAPEPADLDAADRARLTEARAVRGRLKSAFASVTAGAALAERISASLRTPVAADQSDTARRRRVIRLTWRLAPIAAAAALLIAVALLDFGAEPALAGPTELARIHNDNLTPTGRFLAVSDADQIARHFQKHLGFSPRIRVPGDRAVLVGGCVAEFRGKPAATYLLALGEQRVSVIVTSESPQDMGLVCECGCGLSDCTCCHTGQCGDCNIISVRIGDRSYNVVGSVPPEVLKSLLVRLQA